MSSETSTEVAEVVADTPALVDVATGESLAPTVENAARVLDAVSRARDRLSLIHAEAVDVVRAVSREQGKKTFHVGDLDVVLSGGPSIEYDPLALREALAAAECPEERIDAVVKEEITYKVDRAVLKQLTGANEDYKAAAELAERPVEKKWSASTKPRLR